MAVLDPSHYIDRLLLLRKKIPFGDEPLEVTLSPQVERALRRRCDKCSLPEAPAEAPQAAPESDEAPEGVEPPAEAESPSEGESEAPESAEPAPKKKGKKKSKKA